ncbi:MAG TPA: DUF2442 domain-containing protein [Verrucomicrobiota bacterium]|nr:DUF2442 domain-containing protein [Verrucomicrobiota bacterium]
MAADSTTETIAVRCWIEGRRVCVELADGREFSFPAAKYPLLAIAPLSQLEQVTLRVQGRALRWEALDEDIRVADALAGRFPRVNERELAAA